jgi:hypothetical protein
VTPSHGFILKDGLALMILPATDPSEFGHLLVAVHCSGKSDLDRDEFRNIRNPGRQDRPMVSRFGYSDQRISHGPPLTE